MKNLLKTTCAVAIAMLMSASALAQNSIENFSNKEAVHQNSSYVVAFDREGNVHGRIFAIDSEKGESLGIGRLKVQFFQHGKLISQTTTSADGSFKVNGLAEGIYSFMASGDSAFVAHGVNVVNSGASQLMETAAIAPGFKSVYTIIAKETGESSSRRKMDSKEVQQFPATGSRQIMLENGVLTGSVFSNANAKTKIYLFSGQTKIAQTEAVGGQFKFENVKPGIYNYVAAGESGFAAASFAAIENPKSKFQTMNVSYSAQDSDSPAPAALSVVLNSPEPLPIQGNDDDGVIVFQENPVQFLGEQNAFSTIDTYYAPQGGGGGIGMVGGGGNGHFLGKAALITAIIALAEDDNNPNDATPATLNN